MEPKKYTDIQLQEQFDNLRQGNTISPELFRYIKENYTIEHDEYESSLLNVMSKDDEPEEIMQITHLFGETYVVYYFE